MKVLSCSTETSPKPASVTYEEALRAEGVYLFDPQTVHLQFRMNVYYLIVLGSKGVQIKSIVYNETRNILAPGFNVESYLFIPTDKQVVLSLR